MKNAYNSKKNKKLNMVVAAAGLAVVGSGLGLSPAVAATGDVINPLVPETYRYSSEAAARCVPVINGSTNHLGQDMATSDGSAIRSAAKGIVTSVKNPSGGAAGVITIKHVIDGEVIYSAYYHMWSASKYVKVGQTVQKGQRIADVGSSGPSTAPHLHFEIWKKAYYGSGYSVNPVNYMRQHGVDIKKDAYLVYNYNTPKNCTYYAATKMTLYASPTTASKALATVYQNQIMSSVPAMSSQVGSYLKVTVGGVTGWAPRYAVSPVKVRQTEASGGVQLPSTGEKPTTNTPANVKYKTSVNLNLRTGAGVSNSVIKTLAANTEVLTTGKKSGDWLQIKAGSSIGWASSAYLQAVAKPPVVKPPVVAPKPPVNTSSNKVTTDNLNFRTGAGMGHRVISTLTKGTKVTTTGKKSGTWVEIKVGNKIGWVSNSYLSNSVTKPKPPVVTNTGTKSVKVNLNMRSSNSMKGSVVKVLAQNAKVKVLKTSGAWSQIKHGTTTGWVVSSYLK